MQNMLTDIVAKNPKIFEFKLFESLPQKLLPNFDGENGQVLINI